MTSLREAATQALEALEDVGMKYYENTGEVLHRDVYESLKEALAEPVQEPVAWIGYINGVANDLAFEPFDLDSDVKKPLFTAPLTLTDDQLDDIAVAARRGNLYDLRIAIERAHEIVL